MKYIKFVPLVLFLACVIKMLIIPEISYAHVGLALVLACLVAFSEFKRDDGTLENISKKLEEQDLKITAVTKVSDDIKSNLNLIRMGNTIRGVGNVNK